jgi:hypothetical protein
MRVLGNVALIAVLLTTLASAAIALEVPTSGKRRFFKVSRPTTAVNYAGNEDCPDH